MKETSQVIMFRQMSELHAQLAAAREREAGLVKERDEARQNHATELVAARARNGHLRRDNERLRAALERIRTGNWMARIRNSHDSSENRLLGPFETKESADKVAKKHVQQSHDIATDGWAEWHLENDGDQINEIAREALAAPTPEAVEQWRRERELRDAAVELAEAELEWADSEAWNPKGVERLETAERTPGSEGR